LLAHLEVIARRAEDAKALRAVWVAPQLAVADREREAAPAGTYRQGCQSQSSSSPTSLARAAPEFMYLQSGSCHQCVEPSSSIVVGPPQNSHVSGPSAIESRSSASSSTSSAAVGTPPSTSSAASSLGAVLISRSLFVLRYV